MIPILLVHKVYTQVLALGLNITYYNPPLELEENSIKDSLQVFFIPAASGTNAGLKFSIESLLFLRKKSNLISYCKDFFAYKEKQHK